MELSIVHNEPTKSELNIIDEFASKFRIIHCATPRENLYASWNRAVAQSTGEYLACWNVDDLRTEDSLIRMSETLDKNPSVGWTYGDFIITPQFGQTKGRLARTPEWNREVGSRGAIGGAFFMWRRSIHDKLGWFDEQFRSGGDFDFTVRLSLGGAGRRTSGLHGYFLNERNGLSTSGGLQPIERTVIQLRYGIYGTLDWHFVPRALSFRPKHVLQPGGTWIPIEQLVDNYDAHIASRRLSALRIPLQTVASAMQRRISSMRRRP